MADKKAAPTEGSDDKESMIGWAIRTPPKLSNITENAMVGLRCHQRRSMGRISELIFCAFCAFCANLPEEFRFKRSPRPRIRGVSTRLIFRPFAGHDTLWIGHVHHRIRTG